MIKTVYTAFALGLFMLSTSCNFKKEEKILTKEIAFTKEAEIQVKKASNDSILAELDIEIAETEYETQTGLMYRKGMEKNQGMFFVFHRETMKSFYMKNTEFPLDIIFANKDFEVVNIQKNTVPFSKTSLSSGAPAQYVLEVNAGLTDRWNLAPGDKIYFKRIDK